VRQTEVLTNNSIATFALYRALWRGEIGRLLAAEAPTVLTHRFKISRNTVAEHLKARGTVMRNDVQIDEHARMVELFEQGLSLNLDRSISA
jgi:hypothetical protein